ncbi:hypothetical protein [Asanoa siamensis]|uniref:Uncharacterized protein n=1 Tax=Asanoa siamensis TaxID=926357 RepID=A0ABQ4CVL2_9ACTN|nr:hypothetical protein [Asanoa siamensis]GIF75331.1 hypothetical protein Asi02nite_48490 [Asanoa siamensis]
MTQQAGGPRTPPSGLFPTTRTRPVYREPHPVRGGAVAAGAGAGAVWLLAFGVVDSTVRGYAWWTLLAGGIAWLVALLLARVGDRGVAVGVAAATGVGWSVAAVVVVVSWLNHGDWPLW